ncbi:hypothetical protein [Mucilaginibacter sp.]|uniref:hypothetical protein n=1 Tax=Mucilaginibacter sp. TaxID=1882438 RepID=UPI0032672D31
MSSPAVSADLIKLLSNNLFKKLHITRKDGSIAPLDTSIDTRSIWFSKERVDQLFADNGYKAGDTDYGLRIYFGLHDKASILTDIADHEHNRLMAVLVATKGSADAPQDLLNHLPTKLRQNALLTGGELTGEGLDRGKMCPPDICGSI